jgi:hypothetical protein
MQASLEEDRARAEARKALAMLVEGRIEPGFELYDRCLGTDFAAGLQTGLHLLLLEKAGKPEIAARLRELALSRGGNIVFKGVAIEADPRDTATEYEALLERGLFNTRMMESYLMLLMRLGRLERVAQLCDQERLLRTAWVGSIELASEVQSLLLKEEAAADYQEAAQSVRNQRQISPLQKIADPAISELLAHLRQETAAYLGAWAASDHPLAPHVPRAFQLEAWALISRGEGFNTPHIHNRGWATGVYYPAGLGDIPSGGELCVGPPETVSDAPEGWPSARLRPEAGLLVLMPSYYTHWTVPLGRPGLRTAVAFDIVREP